MSNWAENMEIYADDYEELIALEKELAEEIAEENRGN